MRVITHAITSFRNEFLDPALNFSLINRFETEIIASVQSYY